MAVSVTGELDPRGIVRQALEHLDHVLPGQAPIHDFVHHNTLHGFQHLPFEQALAEFTELTGIDCYLSAEQFREFYRQQRITDRDLDAALQQRFGSALTEPLAGCPGAARRELYRAVLLHDVQVITPQQLAWRLRESAEFASETCGGRPLTELWQAVSAKLELPAAELHPEDMLELSAEQLDDWLPQMDDAESPARWFGRVGDGRTWRGVLLALAGKDILDSVRPQLIRLCASLLDEGLAAWRLPQRQELGLYAAWRQALEYDALPLFHDLDDWRGITARLPEQSLDASCSNCRPWRCRRHAGKVICGGWRWSCRAGPAWSTGGSGTRIIGKAGRCRSIWPIIWPSAWCWTGSTRKRCAAACGIVRPN